ncbi:MAG: hypothetical protein JWN56_1494 [Sphingobacteriales bacterium]|nr:hypothetical protein [Sphingobacteriales bacterium]
MKQILIVILLFLFTENHVYGVVKESTDDSSSTELKLKAQKAEAERKKAEQEKKKLPDTTNSTSFAKEPILKCNECKSCIPNPTGSVGKAEFLGLVLLPIYIFVILIIVVIVASKGFKLAEALKENEISKITIPNPKYTGAPVVAGTAEIPPTIEITSNLTFIPAVAPTATSLGSESRYELDQTNLSYRPSISRYIAFVSSLLIIVIAVCVFSFFIYHYIKTGCPPELTSLSTVLIALGVGMVPYAANKVSTAVSSSNNQG